MRLEKSARKTYPRSNSKLRKIELMHGFLGEVKLIMTKRGNES
jgi:hypothetical protein